jgi:hypothetical protein
MIEVQKNLKAIKRMNKGKKLGQLPPPPPSCLKFLKNGFTQNGIESICNVNLKQHPIMMGIQSGPNTMDHNITIFYNHHHELIW